MGFGANVKAMAKERGISLRSLAGKAGIQYNTLYSIVRRDSENVSWSNAEKIAAALNVPVSVLDPSSKIKKSSFLFMPSGKELFDYDLIKEALRAANPELYDYENEPAYKALVRVDDAFTKLNDEGIEEAVKRVEELTEIPKYQRTDNPSEPTQEALEDKK